MKKKIKTISIFLSIAFLSFALIKAINKQHENETDEIFTQDNIVSC